MAKNILGIDIGHSQIKLALMNGTTVKKTACIRTPENLIKNGKVVSLDVMAELIKNTCKEEGLMAPMAAMSISDNLVFEKQVTLPKMSAEQLMINIPYEFKVYINDELKNYNFDYAMYSTVEELEDEKNTSMDLFAVAIQKSLVEDYRIMCRKAGMKLVSVVPEVACFSNLIRKANLPYKEYCILDMGQQSFRLMMYQNDCHKITRELEVGLRDIEQVIADNMNVDVHLAHTFLVNNHEGCQDREYCKDVYNSIAVELQRAVKFYMFSNRESELNDIWFVGYGANCKTLVDTIKENLDLVAHDASELLDTENAFVYAQVAGVLNEEGK
ncbi:MAG: pilus assembly protein PilM [Erysipelotrichaceae bacterium]|nr:pilus assembly protein PilM [Erysipelotrichaceae bacterium]